MDNFAERLLRKTDQSAAPLENPVREFRPVSAAELRAIRTGSVQPVPVQSEGGYQKQSAALPEIGSGTWSSDAMQRMVDLYGQNAPAQPDHVSLVHNRTQQEEPTEAAEDDGPNWGKVLLSPVSKGLDDFATLVTSTASLLERIVMEPIGFLLGDDEYADRGGPFRTLDKMMKQSAQENREYFAEDVEKAGTAGDILNRYGGAVVSALPQAALALLTAGSSLGAQGTTAGLQAASAASSAGLAQTIQTATTNMAKNPQYWLSFLQSAGSSYEQAKADGADDTKATAYALLTSLVNSAVEVGGGIDTLPASLRSAAAGGDSTLRQWVYSSIDEGKEEVVQGAISQLAQSLYGKDNPLLSTTDQEAVISPSRALEEFTGGAVVGGVLGGGQILANRAFRGGSRRGEGTSGTQNEVQRVVEPTPQETAAQDVVEDVDAPVMEAEAQRLFAEQEPVAEPAAPGVEAVLSEGGRRVPYRQLTDTQFEQVEELFQQGRGGMDAGGNAFIQSPGQHIDNRSRDSVASRRVNAFQYDWPNLQQYIRQAAENLIADADISLQYPATRRSERTTQGKQYLQEITESEPLRQAMNMGISRSNIITAAENLIADAGRENNAASKRLELVLDEMLTYGYTTVDGRYFPPDQEYIAEKSRIAGAREGGYEAPDEPLPMWDMEEETQRLYGQQNTAPEAETADVPLRERVRSSIPALQEMAPVSVLDGTEIPRSGRMVDRLVSFVNSIGNRVNRPGFGDVLFSRGRIKNSMIGHGVGQAKIDTFAAVPDVIRNGQQIDYQKNWKGRNYDTYTFAAPINYKGKETYLGVIVTKDSTSNRYYLHEVVDADGNIIFTNNETPVSTSDGTSALAGDLDTVADTGDGAGNPLGTVDTVTDGRASQENAASVEGTRPLNSDFTIPQRANSVNGDTTHSVGAAARGFDPYTRQLEQFGAIPEGENAARPIDVPRRTSPENRVSRTARTILEAAATPDSAVGDIGQAVVDGRFSYMPVSNESARVRAEETIRKKGWEDALADWRADVRAGRTSEQITALGATLYNNAVNAGDTKTALDIAYDMSVAIRNGARATQAVRILKTLEPSGKLYMLQKEVSRLNEQSSKRNGRNISPEDNVPIELWMQRVGENLADSLSSRVEAPKETIRTVADTILSDLKRFADETAPARAGRRGGRTQMDRIVDLFRNRSQYEEAWQAAKDTLADTFENNPQALEAFDLWLDSSLDYVGALTQELTGQGDIRIDHGLADAYLNAETPEARDAALQAIYQNVADQIPSTFREKWNAWRYMAMLTNPRTHVRNVLGNVGFQPLRMGKNLVATAIESGMNAAGIPVERAHSFLASPDLYRAAWADYQNVADALSGNKYNDPQSQIEGRRRVFRSDALETVRRGNSRALELEDAIFKRFTYADTLANYLQANGVTAEQLQSGEMDTALLERARDYAGQEALRATYQDRNAFSNRVNRIARDMGPVGEAILPFRRTPANILVRGVEYSPAGLAKALTYDLYQVQRGNKTAAEAIDGVAAGLTGSALMALGAYLFSEGIVTDGGGDSDDDEWNELMGHQSYALELPNGTSITLDWLAPESLPFFMGVSLASSMGENGMDAESIYDALRSVADPMLELSMLQSVNDLIDSVQYAEEAPLAAMIPSTVISYFSQAIPTLGGQIERTGEDRRMTTYTDRNSSIPTDVQYAIGRASSRIPGWDYQQTPYIDAWGREEETGDELERFANNFLNPAYVSQVDVDEVEQELQRIRDATGDTSVFPDRARRYITVDGERKDLTAEEYDTYARTLGQTRYALVSEAMELAEWRVMSDREKAEYIGDLYEYAGAVAKAAVSNYKLDGWIANASAAEREIGVSTAEYIALYEQYGSSLMSGQGYEKLKEAVDNGLTISQYIQYRGSTAGITSDKDENGNTISGSKKAKVLAAIDEMDLSDEEKDWLYYLNGYSESTIDEAPWRAGR